MGERIHEDTGEVLTTRAADGRPLAPKAATLADTIRLLTDGQFDHDVSADMRRLIRKMNDHATDHKGVSKGSITIKLDIKMMNGAHVVTPSYKIVEPTADQPGTLLFALDDGRLSRDRPDQGAFFGVRDVTGDEAPIRDVG